MSAILTTILTFLKALGIKVAGKALDTGVDQVLTHKERKEEKARQIDTNQTAHRIEDFLATRLTNDTSEQIRNVAAKLRPLIETLHVKTAHDVLDDLRKTIPTTDRKTLSRVDYYRACCSRYINRQQTIDEINLAHQEMTDANAYAPETAVYDPDIVAAKIYVHCINNETQAAIQAANKLKAISRKNIWAWVPDLLFSEDLVKAYEELPKDIDALLVLATSCTLGNNSKSLGVDIDTYPVKIPDTLTYENIPLWTFNLSVLINRFIPEWNHIALRTDGKPGEVTKQLFDATTKLINLQSKTELNDIISDLIFWNVFSGCQINPTTELLEALKTCKCRDDFEEYRVVAYVNILSKQERYEEAKQYLNQSIITPAVLNQRFLLSLMTVDPDYAVETFKMATATQVAFPSLVIIYALSAIKNFPEYVTPYADKVHLQEEKDAQVYQQICKYYAGETPDIQYLLDNRNTFERPFQPFVVIILHANGYIEEGLALMKNCMPDDTVELVNCMYVDLLEQTPSHTADLYEYLRHVREDLGFTQIPRWIQMEYRLASRLGDFPRMLVVSKILYEEHPEDPQYFICLLQSLVHAKEDITLLTDKLSQYTFTPNQVHFIYSQLVLAGHPQQALDLLYNACLQYPTNEELGLSFFHATVNPSTASIINKEYDQITNGSYIHYTQGDEAKTALIDEANRLAFMIGLKKGETIQQPDWRGNPENYQITSIHNKYFQLSERIHKDIADNKYNAVKSIKYTDAELESGKIFEELPRIAGQDQDYQIRYQETLRQYKEGNMSLLAFVKDGSLVSDLYNHLFGTFKFFGFTAADYDSLYKSQEATIVGLQPVLDLPSVILLFELQRKFHISLGQKIIIPRILVHHLEISLQNEMHGSPNGIYQTVADRLSPSTSKDSWLVPRHKELLAWIKDNAIVEDTSERLNQDPALFKQSQYITLFYDCFSLVKPGRVLVSADKTMIRTFANTIPVADVNYLIHDCDQYQDISHFFMEADIYGGDIDADYVIAEYIKHAAGKPSLFPQCKENLQNCPNLFKTTLEVCNRITRAPIVSTADTLVIEELMSSLFQSLGRTFSLTLLQELVKEKTTNRFKLISLHAFKTVYPIIQ